MEPKRTFVVLMALVVTALAGCGEPGAVAAGAAPQSVPGGFGVAEATAVLRAFDEGDSAASSAGDLDALARYEVSPALEASVAGVHRAAYHERRQPAFQHTGPAFALPAADPQCFLVAATLKLTGEEMTAVDLSQFARTPAGDWKLSHHTQVSREHVHALGDISAAPATTSESAVGEHSRKALAAELLARTTGAGTADTSMVASSTLLDKQFAAGWTIYEQQLAAARMTVTRTLQRAEWSTCAATVPGGTVTFLTLSVTDEITGEAGVMLPAESPDMIALAADGGAKGTAVTVSRVDTFLLLIPQAQDAPATLLGLTDAPTKVTTS